MVKDEFLKILVIEDNPGDFALVEEFLLEQIKTPELKHATTYKQAKSILAKEGWFDAILLDLSLPDKSGMELINEMMLISLDIPVIILTGYENVQFGAKSLSLGISDYLLKDDLTPQSLYKSILYSCERKKLNIQLLNHVNAIKKQNEALRDIAWIQSHVVRAPLARMMGLIDLFTNHNGSDLEKGVIVEYVVACACELDKTIMDISNKVHETAQVDVSNLSVPVIH